MYNLRICKKNHEFKTKRINFSLDQSVEFLTTLSFRSPGDDDSNQRFPIRFLRSPSEELPEPDAEQHELFLLDLSCNNAALFLNASEHKMATHYTWLVFDSDLAQV